MVLRPFESEFVRRLICRRNYRSLNSGGITAEIATSLVGRNVVFYWNDRMFVYIGDYGPSLVGYFVIVNNYSEKCVRTLVHYIKSHDFI